MKASLILFAVLAGCAPVVVEGPPPPPPRAVIVAGVPPIRVRAASYGPNCGVPRGNASERVAQLCDGKGECVFRADNAQFGDPAVGCPKAFDVEYSCAGQPRMSRTPARVVRAGEEYRIVLSCR